MVNEMMDCEHVRERLEEAASDERVRAHLERCAACRAEAEFARRVAAAVAAIPRAAAPEGFAARVMAVVGEHPAAIARVAARDALALRPWEIWGLGALGALFLVLLPALLGRWLPARFALSRPLSLSPDIPSAIGSAWAHSLASVRQAGEAWGIPAAGLSPIWLYGAAAFAAAFVLLLLWRPGGRPASGMEDAHA